MHRPLVLLLLLSLSLFCSAKQVRSQFLSTSSVSQLKQISTLGKGSSVHLSNLTVAGSQSLLKPLLVPRVAGTQGNKNVQKFILDFLENLNFSIEQDPFEDDTPEGRKSFNNIIGTKDPNAKHKLVLACHFDSKYFKDFGFIGATDSAAPCAIIMDVARALNSFLEERRIRIKSADSGGLAANGMDLTSLPTLQLIFFDGEEAFHDWTATDSIYGARHLANRWGSVPSGEILKSIDAFVLLDLLGAEKLQLVNLQSATTWAWDRLVTIERRLKEQNLLSSYHASLMATLNNDHGYFNYMFDARFENAVEDDHIPFRKRGVPIVHVIAYPFPSVWHRQEDNASALKDEVIQDLALIFRVFTAEYLGIWLDGSEVSANMNKRDEL